MFFISLRKLVKLEQWVYKVCVFIVQNKLTLEQDLTNILATQEELDFLICSAISFRLVYLLLTADQNV